MTTRTPPTRPINHIRMPQTHFLSRSMAEWGEDDAWDSASDEESVNPNTSKPSTAPKPVPKPALNTSSSTLESSFTYLSSPNPSSYPPKRQDTPPTKNGWTIVRKSTRGSVDERSNKKKDDDTADIDVEGDMVLGDLELDGTEQTAHSKPKQDHGFIRNDVDEIINGTSEPSLRPCCSLIQQIDPLHAIRRRMSKPSESPRQRKPQTSDVNEKSEKVMRERSIRTNRRHKFVECLISQDVNIGRL
jgi:hypothetical protein